MKYFRILIFLCVFSFILYGCKSGQLAGLLAGAPNKPAIKKITPHITGIDLQGVDLAFDIDVLNNYSFPIKSPQMKYSIDIENTEFFKSSTTMNIDLPAKDVGKITLPLRLGYSNLWYTYQNLKDKPEINYTLNGALVLNALSEEIELPVSKSGVFPVLRIPIISDISIENTKVSFGSAALNIGANMTNPNIFGFKTDELGYSLNFGNVTAGAVKLTTLKTIEAGKTERIGLTAEISGVEAITQLLGGSLLGKAKLQPIGILKTPYGEVKISK